MQYFQPSLRYHLSLRTLFCLFLSGRFTQVLLYIVFIVSPFIIGPRREKNLSSGFANNKDADQPAHLCRLISAFVNRLLESVISKFARSQISTF